MQGLIYSIELMIHGESSEGTKITKVVLGKLRNRKVSSYLSENSEAGNLILVKKEKGLAAFSKRFSG